MIVLPTAAAYQHPERVVLRAAEWFEPLGAQVEGLMVVDRAAAEDPGMAAVLAGARFIYLSGGSPLHLRAVLNLPLGAPGLAGRQAVMVNILGGDDPDLHDRLIHVMAADPGVKVHLYGKVVRPGRKVGHVTVVGDDLAEIGDRARRAASYLSQGTEQP